MNQHNDQFFMAKIEALERRVAALEARNPAPLHPYQILNKPPGTWTEEEARQVAIWQQASMRAPGTFDGSGEQ